MVRMRKAPASNPLGNPALPVSEPKAPKKMMKKQESKAEVVNVISNVPAQSNVTAKPKRVYVKKAKAPAPTAPTAPTASKRKYVKKAKASAPAPEIVAPSPRIKITPLPGKPKRVMKPTPANMDKMKKEAEHLQNQIEEIHDRTQKGLITARSAKSAQEYTAKYTKNAVLEDVKEEINRSKERKNNYKNQIKDNIENNKKLREEVRQHNISEKKMRAIAKEARLSYKEKRPSNVMYNPKKGIRAYQTGARTYALPENEFYD